jgi:hypothetical protein
MAWVEVAGGRKAGPQGTPASSPVHLRPLIACTRAPRRGTHGMRCACRVPCRATTCVCPRLQGVVSAAWQLHAQRLRLAGQSWEALAHPLTQMRVVREAQEHLDEVAGRCVCVCACVCVCVLCVGAGGGGGGMGMMRVTHCPASHTAEVRHYPCLYGTASDAASRLWVLTAHLLMARHTRAPQVCEQGADVPVRAGRAARGRGAGRRDGGQQQQQRARP